MKRLQDKVAIVTGGAAGLGRATVELFTAEGAAVSIWDVNAAAGESLAEALTAAGHKAEYRQVDVGDTAAVAAAVDAVKTAFGRLDILINNAGITRDATLLKMEESQFDQVIDVNLKGVFNCGHVRIAERRRSVNDTREKCLVRVSRQSFSTFLRTQ